MALGQLSTRERKWSPIVCKTLRVSRPARVATLRKSVPSQLGTENAPLEPSAEETRAAMNFGEVLAETILTFALIVECVGFGILLHRALR